MSQVIYALHVWLPSRPPNAPGVSKHSFKNDCHCSLRRNPCVAQPELHNLIAKHWSDLVFEMHFDLVIHRVFINENTRFHNRSLHLWEFPYKGSGSHLRQALLMSQKSMQTWICPLFFFKGTTILAISDIALRLKDLHSPLFNLSVTWKLSLMCIILWTCITGVCLARLPSDDCRIKARHF